MTTKPLIEVALRLTGQGFSPEDIAVAIGLSPTKTWRRGAHVQGTQLQRKCDAWIFGLPQRESYEMDALLRELLDAIESYKDRIVNLSKQLGLEREIAFGAYIQGETPAACFAAETMRRVAALEASLEIDLILM